MKSSFVSAVWQEPTRSGVGLDVKLKVSNPGGSEVSSYAVDDSVTTYSVTDSSGTTIEQGRVRLTDDVPAHGAVYAATDARFTWGDEVSSGQAVTLHAGGISKKLIVPKEPEEPEEPETNGALERSVPSAPASAPARTAPGDRSSSSGSSSSGSSSSGSSSSGQLLSPSGRPYEAGQFCPRKYLGMTTTAGNGARITCQPQSGRNHWVAG
ncbi:hypothetical protein ACIBUY_14080 [Streptomyces sp. NPDC050085]|uniref:hypothetical protein n=1 Tax=Streptomyces sp. NPDC050085 TaxID=3365600 RepID=UPI0037A87174